jgi:hypothetical protein
MSSKDNNNLSARSKNPSSEFFTSKIIWKQARGLQSIYTQEKNSLFQRPFSFLLQIARGSGATLSECTFSKEKMHITLKIC